MKLLHIADLHIGKRLHGFSLLEDQRHVLDQIIFLAQDQGCDAVALAGDVYDKSVPSAEAVALASAFFTALAGLGVPVFTISGNHDSPERVACYADILKASSLYMSPVFSGEMARIQHSDEYGPVDVYLLPYIKPATVRPFFPEANILTYEDALGAVLGATPLDPTRRNVLVAHQFVTGAAPGGSEEFVVGTMENVSAVLFDGFDYVALGHIHSAQSVTRATLRYGGAPLAYSFPEAGHARETLAPHGRATIVTLREKDNVSIELFELEPLREVRVVRASMGEILAMPYSEDYIRVALTDPDMPSDPVGTIRMVFPNLLRFGMDSTKNGGDVEDEQLQQAESKTPAELFAAFYAQRSGGGLSNEQLAAVNDVFAAVTGGGEA